jgi:AraC-like DNA-binding protein
MPATLPAIDTGRLERSCGSRGGAIRVGSGLDGIERVEAFFTGRAFEPHRHDTYAIGVTTRGVQAFRYRGALRHCLPGQLHVLHPDELHDGASATAAGFGYRIMYVEPWLVQESLGGRPLPFVADPVQRPTPATAAVVALLADIDQPIDGLAGADAAAAIADGLAAAAGTPAAAEAIDLAAVRSVREYIDAQPAHRARAEQLERIAGIDRWAIARQFRAAYGTSPDRYRTMRRLAIARRAIASGAPLVEAALAGGFADQSHMTRQFRRAYGVTPGRWADAVRHAPTAGSA